MSFMGATSNSDSLRLEGLLNLETIIEKFASIRDPDFPSVSILEQFQAQVSAALRPAFAVETDPMKAAQKLRILKTCNFKRAQVFVTAVENGLKGERLPRSKRSSTPNNNKRPTPPAGEARTRPFMPSLAFPTKGQSPDRGCLATHPPRFAICLSTLPELASNAAAPSQQLERFYLVFGLGMEALCKQPFSELEGGDMETATMFLKSLWALLSSHWPRDVISQEKPLTIELCCVLHRQLVTRCDIKIQKLVIDVLRLVIEGMRENFNKIAEEEDDKDPAGTEKELNSEEEATGEELQASPGNKSVVMSVLEVVFCLLMQKIPTLNSHVSGFQVKSTGTPQENDKLLGETVACLELLPDICSDAVAIGIQPTVLYLTSCILGEPVAQSEACGAVLRCYKKFVGIGSSRTRVGRGILLSTLIKVLDMAKTSDQGGNERQIYLLGAIAIFIKDAPPPSVRIGGVLYPSINTFQQAYQSGNEQEREYLLYSRVGTENSPVFVWGGGEERGEQGDVGVYPRELESYSDSGAVVDSSAKRVQMLTLIVPVLINFLVEPHLLGMPMTAHRKLLHDVSLQKLMKIGLQYREHYNDFLGVRALMGQCTEMRVKLETVIKKLKSLSGNNDENKTSSETPPPIPPGGSIKLKTDFSNFTS
ncbi:HEAT repeat-containing protein 5A [Orchesella cincta]|uniref:HEAT repeat-containing protein 5A n=1 Tax=Orchesella cincta TaxID=48709 RepID=A0A1D2M3Z4_ORCCI|nr:HEAT repeat-containing protein 5A [Orchesella cincta]